MFSEIVLKKFNSAAADYNMIETEGGIAVGLSGGSDSVALLHLLKRTLKPSIPLAAIHINHQIRGEEAKRDELYCKALCERLGIAFYTFSFNVPMLALQMGKGCEEAAREIRYKAFFDFVKNNDKYKIIATAHNANDNVETIIFNLSRGTGIKGLCGIPPVRIENNIKIIRPLIYASKEEINGYCRENKLDFVVDSTNLSDLYTRNHIRHNILPALSKINESYLDNISRAAQILTVQNDFIEKEADKFIASYDKAVGTEDFRTLHIALQGIVIEKLYKKVARDTLSKNQVNIILDFISQNTVSKRLNFPHKTDFVISQTGFFFEKSSEALQNTDYKYILKHGENVFENLKCRITVLEYNDENYKKNKNIYKLSIYTILNNDKINEDIFIRARQNKDSYVCNNMTKQVKKVLSEGKIPLEKRENFPVICDESGIIWVPAPSIIPADRVKSKKEDKNKLIIIFDTLE